MYQINLRKRIFDLFIPITLVACGSQSPQSQLQNQSNAHVSSLNAEQIWEKVKRDPYETLPRYEVNLTQFSSKVLSKSFNSWLESSNAGRVVNHQLQKMFKYFDYSPDLLTDRAVTTINDNRNITNDFDKLVHANGTCMYGEWKIYEESGFTGQFRKGATATFIGRASSALDGIDEGDFRAWGVAGKLFIPSKTNPNHTQVANFFTIDDVAGTKNPFHLVSLSNEPKNTLENVWEQGPMAWATAASTVVSFLFADVKPGIRQLYEVSSLGAENDHVITPKWMNIKVKKESGIIHNHKDFRENFDLKNYKNDLRFAIYVSNTANSTEKMHEIGEITISETVSSRSCDKNLHFHHPKFKKNLRHN